jgi:hypothetical protein
MAEGSAPAIRPLAAARARKSTRVAKIGARPYSSRRCARLGARSASATASRNSASTGGLDASVRKLIPNRVSIRVKLARSGASGILSGSSLFQLRCRLPQRRGARIADSTGDPTACQCRLPAAAPTWLHGGARFLTAFYPLLQGEIDARVFVEPFGSDGPAKVLRTALTSPLCRQFLGTAHQAARQCTGWSSIAPDRLSGNDRRNIAVRPLHQPPPT